MKNVISARDIEDLIRGGGSVKDLPADALLTPSAKDMLNDMDLGGNGFAASPAPTRATSVGTPMKISSKSSPAELEAFFNSPEINVFKEQICDIGRRMWQREDVDGNGGNIAIRVGEDVALCTPTLVSKGFMKPENLCLVDLEGNQLYGKMKRTSEILMHLQMMKAQPRAKATVHCHPPYSTGFAVAGVIPPSCMIPEYEVFASVAAAPYRTPGTPEMGKLVADLTDKHNTILMENHGVVSWSHNGVEDAYFKMEILEAYCRTILVTAQVGKPAQTMTPTQLQDLLKIKQSLGIPDPRHGLKECELCDNAEWRPGVACGVNPSEGGAGAPVDPDLEKVVEAVTNQIMASLK
jgi:L-fuculose-phosphate aldolase